MTDGLPDIAALFAKASEADWRARVDAVLKGADFDRKLVFRSHDGLAIQPLSAARAHAPLVARARAGRPWATAARVDHPDAEAAARQALEDLEGGADMLALVFPGGRSARGYGLPCATVADLDAALSGVRLELMRLRLDPAPGGRIHALQLAALAERRKLDPARLDIDFGLDPIGALLSRGHVPWDWAAQAARLSETAAALRARGFAGPFVTADVRPFHEAGAGEAQELAAGLALGALYLRALEAHGMPLDHAFRAVSFVLPVDADQFMGIAKLRALRKLWARVADACGQEPEPAAIHAETSWRMLARRDPHVNILRATIAAFAAGVGGADTLTVLPFSQALGLPDAAARRLARNSSIVLQEEANLWRVADPAAGSGGVEALTDALCEKAWALFQEIEGEGGLLVSLAMSRLQGRIAATAAARRKAVATRRDPLTGVSEFANLAETPPAVLPVKPARTAPPKVRVRARFGAASGAVIAALLAGASRSDVAPVMDGELRAEPLVSRRSAEPFEALRDRADAFAKRRKRRPAVTLATLGPLADHGPRLQFMRNLFEAAGLDAAGLDAAGLDAAGLEAADAGGAFVCLVGSDAAYAAEGAAAARKLRAKGRTLWLAGRPGEREAALKRAGVRRFVAASDDMLAVLDAALSLAGA
jgi:methylmalonyl-CoA mutase